MMTGVRFAKPEQVVGEKSKLDFEARLESTRALLAAQQRISREKSAGAQAQEATRSIERQMGEAQALAAQNRYADARPVLDRAYLTARISIESMRRGDTLIRSLNFASPREEYDYEIDRNETHRMLITVLLADRKDAAGAVPSDLQAFNEKAALLRRDAEMHATRGDYVGAIKLLEDSTRELIRAIRVGGIYIPG
jgi:multidrug efflux pump subunit AcrA (membrane-fusion protein)